MQLKFWSYLSHVIIGSQSTNIPLQSLYERTNQNSSGPTAHLAISDTPDSFISKHPESRISNIFRKTVSGLLTATMDCIKHRIFCPSNILQNEHSQISIWRHEITYPSIHFISRPKNIQTKSSSLRRYLLGRDFNKKLGIQRLD